MKKSQKFKIQAIQKEQVQLVQIEKTLEALLGDIKESINSMKVEELQLKSSLVEHFTSSYNQDDKPTTSAQAAAADASSSTLLWLNAEQVPEEQAPAGGCIDASINRQLLDLETLLVPMKKREFSDDEEEEEDEEDEDRDDDEMENGDDDEANNENGEEDEEEDEEEFLPEYR